MKCTQIESTGVSGINIELSNVELVALKSFIVKLKGLDSNVGGKSTYDYKRDAKPLVDSMIVFLDKILPEEVISIEQAYADLFTLPVEEVKADNEL